MFLGSRISYLLSLSFSLLLFCAFAKSPSTLASDFAEPVGCWEAKDVLTYLPNKVGLGGIAYAPDGDIIAYGLEDGKIIKGNEHKVEVLATFTEGTFGSFLVLAPNQEFVYFGENSEGNIYKIPLDGSEKTIIDNIPFNFDLTLDEKGNAYVSAPGPNGDNQIYLLDDDPSALSPPIVENIPGFSGPLTFDEEGNLYYGTSIFDGTPLEIRKFSFEMVEEALKGTPIDFAHGDTIAQGIEGVFDMESFGGKLFFTDLGFGAAGHGRLLTIDLFDDFALDSVLNFPSPGEAVVSPTYISTVPGDASMDCGKGEQGGKIAVGFSDFASLNNILEFTPQLHFTRGEVNGISPVDVSDVVFLLDFLFLAGEEPAHPEAADCNDDGNKDISDPIYLVAYLFLGGNPPPAPFEEPGIDPTE